MSNESEQAAHAAELRLMRMRLERLKHDVARATATPLELRIARSVQAARKAGEKAARKGKVLKAKHKSRRKPRTDDLRTVDRLVSESLVERSSANARHNDKNDKGSGSARHVHKNTRPAWGAGSGEAKVEGSTAVYWRKKQAFSKADDVPLEFDPTVIADKASYGPKSSIPGGLKKRKNWHVVEGRRAREILIMQSNKRLGKAYEYLRQEEEDAGKGGYPGLLPSARTDGDSETITDHGSDEDPSDMYAGNQLPTKLRVQDLIDDIYDKKEVSDDYHRVKDEPCLSLEEFTDTYFRVEFGTAVNNRRFSSFKKGVLEYYHDNWRVKEFADAIGWKDEVVEKENMKETEQGTFTEENTNGTKKKKYRTNGGVVLPIPPHRVSDTALLKLEARRWITRGRQLLEARLKACEQEIAKISSEIGINDQTSESSENTLDNRQGNDDEQREGPEQSIQSA